MANAPPSQIDNASVLAWTSLGGDVEFVDQDPVIVGGEVLGRVPELAICRNPGEADVLLFYCGSDWHVLGASYYPSVDSAIVGAERKYRNSTRTWTRVP